jgi:hypothetical protein
VHVDEAFGEDEVAILGFGDFHVAGEGLGDAREAGGVFHGVAEGTGEEAGFEEVGTEVGDFVDVLEADDGEGGGGEAVFAGVLGGTGFAVGGARAGGFLSVGAVGGELSVGHGKCVLLFGCRLAGGSACPTSGLPRGGVGV